MADFRRFRIEGIGSDHGSAAGRRPKDPPGYNPAAARLQADGTPPDARTAAAAAAKKQEALWALAQAPLKTVGFMAFVMWMSGNQLQLFSILTLVNGLYQPAHAIVKSGDVFRADPEGRLSVLPPRLLYCLLHAAGLAYALHKGAAMGLLPTSAADWADALPARRWQERVVAGLVQQRAA